MTIGELIFELGFKTDTVKLNEIVGLIGKLNLSSVLGALGVKELYDGLRDVMGVAEESALGMNMFEKQTGLSAQKMTQWTRYAEGMGVSAEAVSSTLTGLQKKLVGMKLGTDQSLLTPLYILNQAGAGITGNETPFELMNKFLATIKKLNPELKTTITDMMGINSQLLTIDSFKGADLIDVPTSEDMNKLLAYHKATVDLGNTWKNVWESMGGALAPTLDGLATASNFLSNLGKHSETFRGYLQGIGIIIAAIVGVSTGPIGSLILLVTSLLALIGQLVHYWPQLQSLIPKLDFKSFMSDMKNAIHIGLPSVNPQVATSLGEKVQDWNQSRSISQSNTFHITGADAKDIGQHVHRIVGDLLSDAQFQQPLTQR